MDKDRGVSSARQRRRKNRQHESPGSNNKIVLRSRSSSDVSLESNIDSCASQVSSSSPRSSLDIVSTPLSGEVSGCSSHAKELVHKVSHVKSDDLEAVTDPPLSDEVEDLFTLLDSTLKMPEPEAIPPTGHCEDKRGEPSSAQELTKLHLHQAEDVEQDLLLHSGRLAVRIRALRL